MTAMRFFMLPFVFICLASIWPASAAGADGPHSAVAASDTSASPDERLTRLFHTLKRERDPDSARGIAENISRQWQETGSPTIDLLVQWADKAMAEERNAAALDFLDEALSLRPDYVEGWNRRATLHYKMGNFRKSLSDINRVLALEPRHFGAIAGMATIFTDSGRDELALRAWERFLTLYPAERRAQRALDELAGKLAGQRT